MRCRIVIVLLGLAAIAASCSISDTLNEPKCSGDSTVLIAAQSVPTAQLLPCFNPLPVGWQTEEVAVTESGTTIWFESDRAGESAARFSFTATCDIGDAVSAQTEYLDTERFELILEVSPRFRARRHYRFDGGCVSWDFDFDAEAPSALSVELGHALEFWSRSEVNDNIRDTFIDEEL